MKRRLTAVGAVTLMLAMTLGQGQELKAGAGQAPASPAPKLVIQNAPIFRVFDISISPDGKTLGANGCDGEGCCCREFFFRLWSLADGKLLQTVAEHFDAFAFSPDGQILAMVPDHGPHSILLWSVAAGKLIQTLDSGMIHSVYFSPDGKTLAAGTSSGSIDIWTINERKILRTLKLPESETYLRQTAVVFSPDGKMLASAGNDMSGQDPCTKAAVLLWSVEGGKLLHYLRRHSTCSFTVSFSPDSKKLAAGSGDGTIKLWSAPEGKLLRTIEGHSGPINSVSFSPDGKILVSGNRDNTIKLWSINNGKLLRTLAGHTGPVLSISFSPKGNILASGSSDRTIKLWDMKEGKLLCTLILVDEDDWIIYTPAGYFDTTDGGKKFISWTVGTDSYPAEKFWDRYYRPGLLGKVMRGEAIE